MILIWPKQNELCFGCSMNCFASNEGIITKLGFSQNWDKFFYVFFFHWFWSIITHISSKFLATSRLIIIMFRPLDKNDQKILLTLCTKFETQVAPSKLFFKIAEILHDVFYHQNKQNERWGGQKLKFWFFMNHPKAHVIRYSLPWGLCWNLSTRHLVGNCTVTTGEDTRHPLHTITV